AGEDDDAEAAQSERTRSVTYKYDGGLIDYVKHLTSAKRTEVMHPEVIDFESEDTERQISLEIAMQWIGAYTESVHTYANTINTSEARAHEGGFRAAPTTMINRYAPENKLLKEKDENLTCDDVREGPTAGISIKL